MVALLNLFVIIFVSIISLASTNGKKSNELPCRTNDIGQFANEGPDSLKIAKNISFQTCLSLCCAFGEALYESGCLKDNLTSGRVKIKIDNNQDEKEVSWENFYLYSYDPCKFDWTVKSMLKNYHVLRNGWISGKIDTERELAWDHDHYCLFKNPESFEYIAKVCHPFIVKGFWEIFCTIVVIIIMIMIFICYTVVPELKNLHGMIFRSYIITYLITALCVLAVEFTTEVRSDGYWYIVSETVGRYCGFSCILWLNVMSFNIWKSFREMRTINCHEKELSKEKFFWYATYAWLFPAIILSSLILAEYYTPHFRDKTDGYSIKIWTSVGSITIIYMSNTFLYTSTALAIKHYKKNTAHLEHGVNKHHEISEQWFNLYVKLFLIMGGHIIAWIIWFIWPTPPITHAVATLEVMQAVLIFFVFIWKDNIKRSFYERFNDIIRR